jgi:hypothetical protein
VRVRWLVIAALVLGSTTACQNDIFPDAPGVWTEMPVSDPYWSLSVDKITANSATDAWVTGENASFHWDGKIWTSAVPETQSYAERIHKISDTDIWTFGEGRAAHWDGRTTVEHSLHRAWEDVPTIDSVAFAGPKDIWVSGSDLFTHWDGRTWTEQPERPSLVTVSPTGKPAAIWDEPVGIRHWNGRQWISDPLPPIEVPEKARLSFNDLEEDWAVGNIESTSTVRPLDTVVLRFDGTTWQRIPLPLQDIELYAVTPDGQGGIWVGTGDPYVLHYDGRTWTRDRLDLPGHDSGWNISDLALVPGTREVLLIAFNETGSDATDRILRLKPAHPG